MMPKTMDRKLVRAWTGELETLNERIAPRFSREEVRRRARLYLRGLLGSVERKNGWQLAEAAGDATPYGLQHLLGRASWDTDEVRDDLRGYVLERLGDEEVVLIVDETGFLKKGTKSVGVKRQYTGTAGKRENCQVGVFLCYASEKGAAFIDRELYLPEEWANDQPRRREAGVPDEVEFATKPELARKMLQRAFDAEVRAAWVVADSVYGDARGHIGMFLEEKEQPFVLALSCKAHVWAGFSQPRVSKVLDALREGSLRPEESEEGWERLSVGKGSKGERLYDWIRLPLNRPLQEGFARWLLVRRQIDDPNELSAYVVFAPEQITLQELARVAGSRWKIEEAFQEAKGEVGLDHYEVRSWIGWYRHITLALFAHAFLSAIRASGHNDVQSLQKGALLLGNERTPSSSLATFKKRRGL
jgi:SRSO17 transposase